MHVGLIVFIFTFTDWHWLNTLSDYDCRNIFEIFKETLEPNFQIHPIP